MAVSVCSKTESVQNFFNTLSVIRKSAAFNCYAFQMYIFERNSFPPSLSDQYLNCLPLIIQTLSPFSLQLWNVLILCSCLQLASSFRCFVGICTWLDQNFWFGISNLRALILLLSVWSKFLHTILPPFMDSKTRAKEPVPYVRVLYYMTWHPFFNCYVTSSDVSARPHPRFFQKESFLDQPISLHLSKFPC